MLIDDIVTADRGSFRKGLYAQKYGEAKDLIGRFDKISFKWIPREDNVQADALSREAYAYATATSRSR